MGVRRKYLSRGRASQLGPSGTLTGSEHALSDIILASRLDESVVHVTLDALVHTLVDLVDEGKGSLSELGERHEVHDGSEGTLLNE